MRQNPLITRALISVSDKTGIVAFATALQKLNIDILSTGGTAQILRDAGLSVQDVSEHTGLPEMMEGRIKTLHHKIQGGLLGRRGDFASDEKNDEAVMAKHGIQPIDLLVVNLYPFAEAIKSMACNEEELKNAVKQIDIGGPTMLRAAAKNYLAVTVVVDPEDYTQILKELITYHGTTTFATRFQLAQKVFTHTAQYDATISNYLNRLSFEPETDALSSQIFPENFTIQFHKKEDLRYGENPHQKAAFYVESPAPPCSISSAIQHQGKPLSFNNIADTNAALTCVKLFDEAPACVIVKHANPCGVALAPTQLEAYQRAFATDPTSAFGGIIAFNHAVNAKTAKTILENQFLEVLIAPAIEETALNIFAQKPNIRVLSTCTGKENESTWDYTRVNGGLLVQEKDNLLLSKKDLKVVTHRQPSEEEFQDMLFAWEVAKCVKSNAIVYAKDRATIGIGAGQMSRVFSAIIAGLKAKDANLAVSGSVMASDAFFPFEDGINAAIKAGITAIIQPGGSIRDSEVIAAANKGNIAMVFTGVRHFRH